MNFLKSLSPHVHWGLRLSLAATFLYHGATKLPVEGPMMGMPAAMVWMLAFAELAAGFCWDSAVLCPTQDRPRRHA